MKSAMRFPFHSLSPGSSRCEHKKAIVISCSFSLVAFLKTLRVFPWTCDAWGCSELCAQTWGSPRSPRALLQSGRAVLRHPWVLTHSGRGHLLKHRPALGSTWLAPEVSQPVPSRPRPVRAGRSNEITAGARGDMAAGHHLT